MPLVKVFGTTSGILEEKNRFISNSTASISAEVYQFLTLVTRTKYFTKKLGSGKVLVDVKICACDYDSSNF